MYIWIKEHPVYFVGILITIIWGVVSAITFPYFKGNPSYFILFCVSFWAMWGINLAKEKSYFYIFLSTFLMLGFWLKGLLEIFNRSGVLEPIGSFNDSPQAWNKVLLVSAVAASALFFSRLFYISLPMKKGSNTIINEVDNLKIPEWYKKNKNLIWCVSVGCIIFAVVLNILFSIDQVGVIPLNTHFPFKLNLVVSFLLNAGISFWLAVLVWWDLCLGKSILPRISFVFFATIAVSSSLLSRGFYLYQMGHYFVSLVFIRAWKDIPKKAIFGFFMLFLLGFIFNFKIVMAVRDHLFPSYTQEQISFINSENMHASYLPSIASSVKVPPKNVMTVNKTPSEKSEHPSRAFSSSGVSSINKLILDLIVGRWIGLEGIMTVSSLPNLNQSLLSQVLAEEAVVSHKRYDSACNAIYARADYPGKKQYCFASLPGIVAILYYSGSLTVVFVSMFILAFVIYLSEMFWFRVLLNPFVMSYYGIYLAILLSMFYNTHVFFAQLIEVWIFLSILWFAQTKLGPLCEKVINNRLFDRLTLNIQK